MRSTECNDLPVVMLTFEEARIIKATRVMRQITTDPPHNAGISSTEASKPNRVRLVANSHCNTESYHYEQYP